MAVQRADKGSRVTRRWRISTKLAVASILTILLTLLAGGVGLWQVFSIGGVIGEAREKQQQLVLSIELLAAGDGLVGAMDHMLVEQNSLLASIEVIPAMGLLKYHMETLQSACGEPETLEILAEMDVIYNDLYLIVDEVNLRARERRWTDVSEALEQQIRPANDQIYLLIQELVRQADLDVEAMTVRTQSAVRQATLLLAGLVVLTTAIALAWRQFVFRGLGLSIGELRQGVARITSGDLKYKLYVRTGDEIEELGEEFNKMADELSDLFRSLEQRVAERTRDLERRSVQLEAGAQVAREAAAIRDPGQLLDETVRLISDQFGFYHAGIFLLDEPGEYAVLRAASSEGGQRMLARGHQLRVGEVGIVGHVASTGEPRIALDVGEDAVFFDNPDLPETRSEMALPLKVRGRATGVLDVQSREPGVFSEEDVAILQTMADQVALALENARLLEERQRALRELEALYARRVREGWRERVVREPAAYRYTRVGVEPAPPSLALEVGGPPPGNRPVVQRGEDGHRVIAPIRLRGQALGSIYLRRDPEETPWSPEEVALVGEVSTQVALALENARLLEETQRRAQRDRLIADITARVRSSMHLETILQTAVRELGAAFGTDRAVVQLTGIPGVAAGPGGGAGAAREVEGEIAQGDGGEAAQEAEDD